MKKLFFLTALLCASLMSWADVTPYCEVLSPNENFTFSLMNVEDNVYRIQFDAIGDIKFGATPYNNNCGVNQTNGAGIAFGNDGWIMTEDRAYKDFTTSSEESYPTTFFGNYFCFNQKGGGLIVIENFNPSNVDWTAKCECEDKTKPAVSAVAVGSITHNSAVLTITASDNVAVTNFAVKNGDTQIATSKTNIITLTGLSAETTYSNIKVYAYDKCENESDAFAVESFTTEAAPSNPFCNLEVGHHGEANAPADSYILLSISSLGNGLTLLTIRQDAAKNNAMFDFININGIKTFGMDVTSGGSSAMSAVFNTPAADGDGNIIFTFQWSTVDWAGRWEYTVTLPADATCNYADPAPAGPYTYCEYTDNQLKLENANVTLTWETNVAGDVVITLGDGEGATNTHFRNEGFENEGSFDYSWKVFSGTNHLTCEPASTYFTPEYGVDGGNTFALRKKDGKNVPNNAVIYFQGHAFSWKNDQKAVAYVLDKTFTYSYGENCGALSAPTNVAVNGDSIITFDAVTGAEHYTAYVYFNSTLKYQQAVASGDVLHFFPYEDGTYQVNVVAGAEGKTNSDPSADYDWVLIGREAILTSISLSSASAIAKIGEGVALTVNPIDQNGNPMAVAVEYEITPAAAGSVVAEKFMPAQTGAASIVAYNGEVRSNAITVYGVVSDNLAYSSNIDTDNKVISQSDFSPKGTNAFFAVDGNDGSVYQGSPTDGTDADEASRTFDAWFIVDLGRFYNIDLITIHFEGACSQEYHVDFSEDNTNWQVGYNYVGSSGVNNHTDYLTSLANNKKVHYVRFWSTKSATQYGMKIYEFQVYGPEWSAPTDIKNTEDSVKAVKMIENGQLVIIKNGVKYNVAGQQVK